MENLKTNNENIFEANNFLAEENHLSYTWFISKSW